MLVIFLVILGGGAFYLYYKDREKKRPEGDYKPRTKARFRNPANGYEEDATSSWLWCFLFGPFYFALKGVWTHALFSAGLAICTVGVSWLFYPFFAREIVQKSYLRKGWLFVDEPELEDSNVNNAFIHAVPSRSNKRIQAKETKRSTIILVALLVFLFFGPGIIFDISDHFDRKGSLTELSRNRDKVIADIKSTIQNEDYLKARYMAERYKHSGDAEIIQLYNEADAEFTRAVHICSGAGAEIQRKLGSKVEVSGFPCTFKEIGKNKVEIKSSYMSAHFKEEDRES